MPSKTTHLLNIARRLPGPANALLTREVQFVGVTAIGENDCRCTTGPNVLQMEQGSFLHYVLSYMHVHTHLYGLN